MKPIFVELTLSVTHLPPEVKLPKYFEVKIDEAGKFPVYLVSSNHGMSVVKPHSWRSMSSKVQI